MEKECIFKINELTVLDFAVSAEEGDRINARILLALEKFNVVILDFSDIKIITTAFLNSAIGQLYKKYSSEDLSQRLKLLNVSPDDLPLFKKVVDRAKEYYNNPESFGKTINNIIKGE